MSDVRFPPGTPEYAAYMAELTEELAKFSRREAPYDQEPEVDPARNTRALKLMGMNADDIKAAVNYLENNK